MSDAEDLLDDVVPLDGDEDTHDKKRKHVDKEDKKEKKKHKKDKKEKKEKKDKKDKKEKKEKKEKKAKKSHEEEEEVWVEAGKEDEYVEQPQQVEKPVKEAAKPAAPAAAREDWMMAPPKEAGWLLGRKKQEEEEEEKDPDNIPVSSRELNPYVTKGVSYEDIPAAGTTTTATPTKVVGDGGASWRARALRRAKESAAAEGRELDDVVKERFNNVEELLVRNNTPRSGDRRGGDRGGQRERKFGSSDYLQEDRHKMRRPESGDLRWSSRESTPSKEGDSSRDNTPYKEPRWRTPQKDDEGDRRRDGDRDRKDDRDDRDRNRDNRDRRDRDDDRDRNYRNRDDDRRHNGDRDRDRDRDRDSRDRDRDRDRNNRDRDNNNRDRDEDRGRDKRDGEKETKATASEVEPKELTDRDREILREFEKEQKSDPYGYSAPKEVPQPVQTTPPRASAGGGGGAAAPEGGMTENKLASLILKAKMKGDKAAMQKYQEQLDALQQAREAGEDATPDKVVKVVAFDERGRPISSAKKDKAPVNRDLIKGKRAQTHDEDGKRTRYYADDDVDLKDLVDREKREGVQDFDIAFAKTLVGSKAWKADGNAIDMDDFDDVAPDAMAQVSKNRAKKMNPEKAAQQQRAKAIASHNREENILENCWFCLESSKVSKHLIVSLGNKAYLSLPKKGTLTDGHCQIVPIPHATGCTMVDEEVWEEIRNFKKCLIKMFYAQGRDVVFLETVMNLKKKHHTYIECIPLPKNFEIDPALYFQKAINESEGEWSQHRKLIDMKARGGLRRSVPKDFPYFAVDFGVSGDGYAHVIEDELRFPRSFGKEIIAGMLDIDESVWLRPKFQTFEEERQRVLAFLKPWEKYDWTKMLD